MHYYMKEVWFVHSKCLSNLLCDLHIRCLIICPAEQVHLAAIPIGGYFGNFIEYRIN